jgi:two-component system response regulator LytT
LIDYQNKIIPLNVDDIAFFYLDKSIVKVITASEKKFFISVSLNDLEQMLNPLKFYRANRQFLINKSVIENVEKNLFRKLIISLKVTVPETIVISKDKATHFLKWREY